MEIVERLEECLGDVKRRLDQRLFLPEKSSPEVSCQTLGNALLGSGRAGRFLNGEEEDLLWVSQEEICIRMGITPDSPEGKVLQQRLGELVETGTLSPHNGGYRLERLPELEKMVDSNS